MEKQHQYEATIQWTGNSGSGTNDYKNYERSHEIYIEGKTNIAASADPSFRGDKSKHNPEELLVASLSSCHMLWYLHLCSEAGIVVIDYIDRATGILLETPSGGGHFTEVTLHPFVTVKERTMVEKAHEIHQKAQELCFIANSVNFPVKHQPTIKTKNQKGIF